MQYYCFEGILLNDGWLMPGFVGCDQEGIITYISGDAPDSNYEQVKGLAVPAFQNAHSHAFQYAMAGIAERHQPGESPDDFWSWRSAMYKLALAVDPDDMESIAAMLYAEMLRHGYGQVAEFHYVHHDKDGDNYENVAEMGERLVAAAKKTGIKITLIPIFYQKGGFGVDYNDQQRRFISNDLEEYQKLWEASLAVTSAHREAFIGVGFHSLRAVEETALKTTLETLPKELPVHIHVAEQLKEIEDAISHWGARPVEWLLQNVDVTSRFHLVHATHLDDAEVRGIAKAKAQVVLCPSTEGNLGDGIFRLREYQDQGGRWSIGTDSHVGLNPLEELRLLDYGQRLTSHKRNSFYSNDVNDSGSFGFDQALLAGRAAMGNSVQGYFEIGKPLDAVIYDANQPLLATTAPETLLSTIIYSIDSKATLGTIINGEWKVQDNHHQQEEEIRSSFINTIKKLEVR